jgi:branched-chain amino acid transport system ATP-binding protein
VVEPSTGGRAEPGPPSGDATIGPDETTRPLLEATGLAKAYGGIRAVRDCSFSVAAGSITALIGPNGAGKTTAFDLINGIVMPDAGTVLFDGRDVTGRLPHHLTRLGMSRTFQLTRDLADLTVLENMVVSSPAKGLRALVGNRVLHAEEQRAMELLDFVGIASLVAENAKKLSYGQKKLLEFASVLMSDPRLVLLDEPAGGVNPALLERIVDRIRQLNATGVTFLIVEHNMDVVMQLSDSIVVMAHGEVLTRGTPEQIQNDNTVLDAYLGRA